MDLIRFKREKLCNIVDKFTGLIGDGGATKVD